VKFTIDTDTDSYERACEVVNAAYGRPAHPHLVSPVPLAEGEVWRDETKPATGGWTEEQLRAWARYLWELPDVALMVHWICSRPAIEVKSYRLGQVLAGETGNEAFRRGGTAIKLALKSARSVGQSRMPFARNDTRRSYTAAATVASVVLDELSRGPLHALVLERAELAARLWGADDGIPAAADANVPAARSTR